MKYYTVNDIYRYIQDARDQMNVRHTAKRFPAIQEIDLQLGLYCIEAAKEVYGVEFADMQSKRSGKLANYARYGAAWLMRQKTELRHKEIGALFHRGHQMSYSACKTFGQSKDPAIIEERKKLLKEYDEYVQVQYDKDIPF